MIIKDILPIAEKRILIIGNRSYKNLGDELILLWTIKLLTAQHKKITIAAYDPKWLQNFLSQQIDTSHITFVTEIPKGIRSRIAYIRQGKFKERKLYKHIDAVIIGWGEILTEENKNSYRYRLVSLLPCIRKPRYLMGGIQLPTKWFNKLLYRILLKRTKHIFARDYESVQSLKTVWFLQSTFFMDTAYYAYDWVSFQKIPPSPKIGRPRKKLLTPQKYIIINLNKNAEQFLPIIIQDVQKYYQKGYKILYAPIAKGTKSAYKDREYAQYIKTKAHIKDQQFTIIDREHNIQEFIQVVANADMVISSRLHLFLIASFLNVPTTVYPYQKKILKMQQVIQNMTK